ncbi:SoxR reducing system RseC family protein [Vibrio sp. Of7-15]|uniref:SoxR reducing system RseC family protein n=1 Tax=Vibrio sp. Of7-15 TaxID=2724879 RepID=UPI001EF21364|nr:SoxR reducing system RseC family protein [Vibrio sp. Of7-15]MCG7499065.1 SoxR reducing system RseC family protein [Vibrio sp. Of7-15]
MMTALATVLRVDSQRVTVGCQQETSCGHCSSRSSCGTGIVSKALPGKEHQWQLTTDTKLHVGELVEIGLPEKSVLQSALVVYMVPLLFLILGAGISEALFSGNELITIATSVLFTGLGITIAKLLAKAIETKTADKLRLIRVLGMPLSANMATNAASEDS